MLSWDRMLQWFSYPIIENQQQTSCFYEQVIMTSTTALWLHYVYMEFNSINNTLFNLSHKVSGMITKSYDNCKQFDPRLLPKHLFFLFFAY